MNGSSDPETLGKNYEKQLRKFIEKRKGRYVRDESGELYVMLGHDKISLSALNDPCLINLMVEACGVSTLSLGAKVGLQRLSVHAYNQAGHLSLRTFSSVSKDKSRLYLPLKSGTVLSIDGAKSRKPQTVTIRIIFGSNTHTMRA